VNIMAMRWGKLYRGTPAELSLEEAVAELGVPYRTQFPGYLFGFRFFPDFLLPTLGVVLEVDDPSHNRAAKVIADEERTQTLAKRGFKVARCTNEEALEDPRGAVRTMLASMGCWPLPTSRRGLAGSLPRPQNATQKARRAAKASATRARRAKSVNKKKKLNEED